LVKIRVVNLAQPQGLALAHVSWGKKLHKTKKPPIEKAHMSKKPHKSPMGQNQPMDFILKH